MPQGFAISPLAQRPGSVRKLLPGRGLAVANLSPATVNQSDLSVDATICTPAIDREDESITPEGVDFAQYARNPVVMWEHGFCPEIPTPIAISERDGVLSLRKSPGLIEATAYFSQRDPISYQIFGLIADRIIRATSIHVIPRPGTIKRSFAGGRAITVYPQSDLLEWSFGCLGVNPESVTKVLDAGKIGGDGIVESVRKTLTPWAARPRGNGVGYDFGGVKKCAGPCTGAEKCAACTAKENDMSVAKNFPPGAKPEDEEAKKKAMATPPGEGTGAPSPKAEEPPAEPPPEEMPEEEMMDDGMKPSARVLGAVHESISSLIANIEGAANQYENPDVVTYLQEFVEGEKERLMEIEGLLSDIGGGDTELAEVEEADEEVVKSWLATARGKGDRLKLSGLASQVERIAKAMPTEAQSQAYTIAKSMRAITKKAMEDSKGASDAEQARKNAALQAQIDQIAATQRATLEMIQTVMPAN